MTPLYCDHCGCFVAPDSVVWIDALPCDIDSANQGESASLCFTCHEQVVNTP